MLKSYRVILLTLALLLASISPLMADGALDQNSSTTELIYFHVESGKPLCPTVCESYTTLNPMYGVQITRKDCYRSTLIVGFCTITIPEEQKPLKRHNEDYYNTLLRKSTSFQGPKA